jgi:hypothetical protein
MAKKAREVVRRNCTTSLPVKMKEFLHRPIINDGSLRWPYGFIRSIASAPFLFHEINCLAWIFFVKILGEHKFVVLWLR